MKVKDIQIDGFGVWTGLSVDALPEGMTLFYGPNEAGKTTLMQFMRAMLYGFTADRRDRYVPPIYGGTPGGALRVTGPGGGYEIRRHSQLTDTNEVGRLTVTGQDGLSQGQHRLGSLLGQIDEPIFTNVFAIGIRELQELSTLDDTSAADELYKLSSGLDRVSLVDVLRSLRGGRKDIVGPQNPEDEAEAKRLAGMLNRRERLRDEVEQLTRGGRRWSELATQRRAQSTEIEQLTERLAAWEREAKTVETATSVYETWSERAAILEDIIATEKRTFLPDEAPGQLVQIEAMVEERRGKLEEVKQRRREIREKADQLPVSKRMLDLQGRIEAATEQATWVEALEEQIDRLDHQAEKARKQLDADAERLGMDEVDRAAIVEGDTTQLPDLSKQTLATLSAPAKQVKEQLFQLKQARTEATTHKSKADSLGDQLREVLDRARASNLQQAIREENDIISKLRHRIQIGEHLEKLKRHYRDLERESVDLTTDQVIPIDRLPMLSIPFIFGGGLVLYGIFNFAGVTMFVGDNPDQTWGMLSILFGAMSLLVYYLSRERGSRSTSFELEDCDRQIDTLRKQIREVESEKNELDTILPSSGQTLELRLRESEALLAQLESLLPTYHSHQAAVESYTSARSRASKAADGLKTARQDWSETLKRLGLSESMSPASVRTLSDGYETLQASLRRMEELQTEKDQRRRERQSISKRIETLYLEALDIDEAESQSEGEYENTERESNSVRSRPRNGPLEQLNHLHEELSRQQHWIKRRRELRDQDMLLKKSQGGHFRAIERGEQQRRALWAKCGVATAEQFYEMVDAKAHLVSVRAKAADLDSQVRKIIGQHTDYDAVAVEIADTKLSDLERRWDSLTTRMTETEARIAHLRTTQGELTQEMKQLGDDNRLATAQLELGCVERQIESLARRWQTLAMASCLLEDVCATFERERQPETLREASSFLSQLTNGKYTRIWTPLGTNQLKIDGQDDKSLPLEVLSRGTREAVFIALRLSLAAAYARRGVMLPLVLDDVLVNFDRDRALYAARTLKTFSELGHQVMMFTCHQHIVDIFHEVEAEVRMMPPQGEPGRATVLLPAEPVAEEEYFEVEAEVEEESEEEYYEEEVEEEVAEVQEPEPEPVHVPTLVIAAPVQRQPEYNYSFRYLKKRKRKAAIKVEKLPDPKPLPKPKIVEKVVEFVEEPVYIDEPEFVEEEVFVEETPATIGWAWFEREPADGRIDEDEVAAEGVRSHWIEDDNGEIIKAIPDDVMNRDGSWWNGNRMAAS